MQFSVYLRPSSHSSCFTIVAEFKNESLAATAVKKASKAKRGTLGEAIELSKQGSGIIKIYCRENRLILSSTHSPYDDPEEIVEGLKKLKPTKIKTYETYQELRVEAELPQGVTPANLALLLPNATAQIIAALINKSVKIDKRIEQNGTETWVFTYAGERIYHESDDKTTKCFITDQKFLALNNEAKIKVWSGD